MRELVLLGDGSAQEGGNAFSKRGALRCSEALQLPITQLP